MGEWIMGNKRYFWSAIAMILVAGSLSASASQIISYNSAGYVSATVNNQDLSGGQVAWSMSSPRNPASGYTGPVFFGGASAAESGHPSKAQLV